MFGLMRIYAISMVRIGFVSRRMLRVLVTRITHCLLYDISSKDQKEREEFVKEKQKNREKQRKNKGTE